MTDQQGSSLDQSQSLVDTIIDRLAEAGLGEKAEDLVLAAVEGDVEFEKERGSGRRFAKAVPEQDSREPAGAYLTGITVEGFRGIGPKVDLDLTPGPGLTVVTGRNGSGKSTFAEALEIALTGQNQRWADRSRDWLDGWRNLHHGSYCEVSVGLSLADGEDPRARIHRLWAAGETDVGRAITELRRENRAATDVAALGWTDALTTFKPILSHNELGQTLTGRPSDLFDMLSAILGLAALTEGVDRLKGAATDEEKGLKAVRTEARVLRAALESVDDPRAQAATKAMRGLNWDLDQIEALTGQAAIAEDPAFSTLTSLSTLQAPAVDKLAAASQRLREALQASEKLTVTPHAELAGLLESALRWHEGKGPSDCPVCGTGMLDAQWAEAARDQVQRLAAATTETKRVMSELQAAEGSIKVLIPPPPDSLHSSELATAQDLLAAWRELASPLPANHAMAEHVERLAPTVAELVQVVRQEALRRLEEREGTWRPYALKLAAWVGAAREVAARAELRTALLTARDWLVGEEDTIRNARLLPLASKSSAIWEQLRQESNVELAGMTLVGAKTRRKVDLDVRVDGSASSALAVMSQGELNALALSIFLPRATLPESPFRFLVIDDPVQAMDPSKVDGLARVLHAAAADRQVIVFTHDDRLPQSLRRLRLDATVLEVQRGQESRVQVRRVSNAVTRQWLDARALLKDDAVSDKVLRRVVPGILRASLEAACQQKVRRTRLGAPHGSREGVEELLMSNSKLYPLLAVALFDDERRTADVLGSLNNRFGHRFGDLVKTLNQGSHGSSTLDRQGLASLALDTRDLIRGLQEWSE